MRRKEGKQRGKGKRERSISYLATRFPITE